MPGKPPRHSPAPGQSLFGAGAHSEQPILMNLEGDFRGFYTFLQALERQPRIMRIGYLFDFHHEFVQFEPGGGTLSLRQNHCQDTVQIFELVLTQGMTHGFF